MKALPEHWLRAEDGMPPGVRAFMTTREGGTSAGPWGAADGSARGMNLGGHCGDDPRAVLRNRALLSRYLPAQPVWLTQVHGTAVHDADAARMADAGSDPPTADAIVTARRGRPCTVLVADCMPVLMAAADGTAVCAAHAGWRGLVDGVLEASAAALRRRAPHADIVAWLGAAIGPAAFEVGPEVREGFCDRDARAATAFRAGAPGKWFADIYALGRLRLSMVGIDQVRGGGLCTVSDPASFYSYRRDRVTGRMAACVWIE